MSHSSSQVARNRSLLGGRSGVGQGTRISNNSNLLLVKQSDMTKKLNTHTEELLLPSQDTMDMSLSKLRELVMDREA